MITHRPIFNARYGFVRFKDGLSGHVRLRRQDLTGALAPLQDVQFFEQASIDCGAVAWPGEIDLAPDVMYAEVTFRSQLPRLYELKDLLTDPSHPDAYFQNLEDNPQDGNCLQTFGLWEKELRRLDPAAWESLKSKASRYLQQRDKKGRGWHQLFDALGEAFAYNYLKASVGCSEVCFIPEAKDQETPDLEGVLDSARLLCEVKTINVSDDEIEAHRSGALRKLSGQLSEGFLSKLDKVLAHAKSQLQSFDPEGNAQHMAYLNVNPDDWVPDRWDDYAQQVNEHLKDHHPEFEVVLNIGPGTPWTRVVASPEGT